MNTFHKLYARYRLLSDRSKLLGELFVSYIGSFDKMPKELDILDKSTHLKWNRACTALNRHIKKIRRGGK